MASRQFLEMDNVMWECDYPHSDSTWPFSPEQVAEHFGGVSAHDIDRLTHLNAMRHFRFDPGRPLDECTVGALRGRATDVDVTPKSAGRLA